ncbi:MAG TPA: efflux transporter periplasmic adaptor subunit [Hydrogenophaga sp.]|uniref:efflux RND transporter periplasmic adaptor subunit n=1 Tax=Hydrogenophaga sp. TaxID=1904254 RepID=UPI0008AD21E2|nr:efflux RND transporter periplasmic adaptor subunit [Hydrogenophaga sp.]OGA76515.1 MAG: efflux transporter periplasmic adaptor subunit [Burkholderiales bacterium GWE1_65_30]OGA91431.1 MAG: efflux transporter periplasmic adaptor subunit [Burkholderiales bacterium GWF1_66_17]HAX19846.1 efflux transporter periplasmic adaptor subunit [Hydrogenophaga sp.]HBU20097.1 efflux transporter periplasmic adaptor subunit [Hydrogenophaga sp.]
MNPHTTRSTWLKWLLLAALVLAIGLGVARALNKRKLQSEAANAAAAAMQQAPVYQLAPQDVTTVQALALSQAVGVSGALKALQTAAIKAKVAGELQGLQKREGESVSAGEVVARIDSTDAQARVRQAEQQAKSAQAQVAISRRALENNQSLVKQGFISATALETTSNNLAAAEATHQAALAALDIARKALGDTTLRSPLTGQVSARLVQNGERVALDARVLEVVDLSGFELEAALAPADAMAVAPGQKARLTVEGLAQPVDATVARINPSVQAGSRSVLVYLRVPAVAGMRQGLFAQGQIVTGQLNAPAVPLSAVRNDKPQPYIQTVTDGKIAHVPVVLGRQGLLDGEPMLVIDGVALAPVGTTLLRVQAGLIREGTAVTLTGPKAAATAPATSTVSH